MAIKIDEQEKVFYLATEEGWKKQVGHEIKIGEHAFCATASGELNPHLIISEVTSGARFTVISLNYDELFEAETKDSYLKFLYNKAINLEKKLKGVNLKSVIETRTRDIIDKLGPKPPTENFHMENSI